MKATVIHSRHLNAASFRTHLAISLPHLELEIKDFFFGGKYILGGMAVVNRVGVPDMIRTVEWQENSYWVVLADP